MINQIIQSTGFPRLKKAKGFVLASLIAGAVALPFVLPVQKARAHNGPFEQGGDWEPLLGTWLVQTTLDPSTVPPGTTLVFTIVPTFGAGGGIVQGETGNGPAGDGGAPDAHGNWTRIGYHRYAGTMRAPNYDDAHHFTGERKVKEIITVNQRGDELTGSFRLDLSLADGTILPFHPAGTYHGVRMPIEPLN